MGPAIRELVIHFRLYNKCKSSFFLKGSFLFLNLPSTLLGYLFRNFNRTPGNFKELRGSEILLQNPDFRELNSLQRLEILN